MFTAECDGPASEWLTCEVARADDAATVERVELPQLAFELPQFALGFEHDQQLASWWEFVWVGVAGRWHAEQRLVQIICAARA